VEAGAARRGCHAGCRQPNYLAAAERGEGRAGRGVPRPAPAFHRDPQPPHGGCSGGQPGASSRHTGGGPGTPKHDQRARRGRSAADCREKPSPAQPRPA
ncbi:unnamed protein product, partial [Ixodes pacificus]